MAMEEPELGTQLIVAEASNGDNSTISLSPDKMDELGLFRGDTVLIQGKKRHSTACCVLADKSCGVSQVKMNKVVRRNLRVRLGDVVGIQNMPDIEYGDRVDILPLEGAIEATSRKYVDNLLRCYFSESYRPVKEGDLLLVRGAMREVEFKIVRTFPAETIIVSPETVIHVIEDHV